MNYIVHILIMVLLYSILALSLNILAGYARLLSVCHAAFFGIGAYATALLTSALPLPWVAATPLALLVAALIAGTIGRLALRFRDDYFVLATFALQVILSNILENWTDLTGGSLGFSGIRPPSLGSFVVVTPQGFFLLYAVLLLLTVFVVMRVHVSPVGRLLRSIGEDEVFCQSMGKDVASQKRSAFMIGALFAAAAGSLYAAYRGYIDPESFSIQESVFILALVILGGARSALGSIAAAAFMVTLPEMLRFVGIGSEVTANARQILYGALLVVFMIWRVRGFPKVRILRRGQVQS